MIDKKDANEIVDQLLNRLEKNSFSIIIVLGGVIRAANQIADTILVLGAMILICLLVIIYLLWN
jgi:hypothetical protein